MKNIQILFILLLTTVFSFGQNSQLEKYKKAEDFLKTNEVQNAYEIFKELNSEVSKSDTLYNYVTWYYEATTSHLENSNRLKENYQTSLKYGLEALNIIQSNKEYFNPSFAEKEPWMVKNIIVSYFGLGKIEEAKKYKEILYQSYKDKSLPKGIDGYFNFDFFKFKDKNVWGYEWFPELPDNRFSSSFTKVVYYIYSTNEDGTDKDQLYRFHVLMYHQENKDTKFDYLLERQIETDDAIVSGSYYQYVYKKDIDYKKLKSDIIEILTKEIEPSSRRTIPKRK